jgi:hypothetical protein
MNYSTNFNSLQVAPNGPMLNLMKVAYDQPDLGSKRATKRNLNADIDSRANIVQCFAQQGDEENCSSALLDTH